MAVETYTDINALPEDCIANVLSLTNPKDACRLSLVASTFRSASRSDAVWTRFLPSDYRDMICRAIDGHDSLLANFHSKKDLYLYLCENPILIDGGRKSFSLEKLSGKKCYVLAARELSIVWGYTVQYWQWISLPESRFSEVAELLDVCWLEIRGRISMKMLSPNTNYAAYFVFSRKSNMYGFNHEPAEGFVGPVGHGGEKRTIRLDPDEANRERHQFVSGPMGLLHHHLTYVQRQQDENVGTESNVEYPKRRDDGWMEVELGEYFVKGDEEDGDLEMSLLEVKGGNWKRGLIVQGIEIRPKYQN